MKTTLRQIALSALLAVGFLSAGAFAAQHETGSVMGQQNYTVIIKQAPTAA
ncbi:MAG: hypothetical protein LCH46_14630 [Proteobacteria bacterium]|nr:hypothetical protein [Pseudomonadota bacterium]